MIEINPRYEQIFNVRNIDDECTKIANMMSTEVELLNEALDAGKYKQAVKMYLQLLKAMCVHFVEDEHYCYFDDLYAPEYILQNIFEKFQMSNMDFDAAMLLKVGHDEIMQTECYQEYGYPSYL